MNHISIHGGTSPIKILVTINIMMIALLIGCSVKQPRGIPAEVTNETKNPLPDLSAVSDAGKNLYAVHCLFCHGADGKTGESTLGASPTDLTAESVVFAPDGKLFLIVKNGVRRNSKQTMPPAKDLTDEQVWQLVAYLRTLAAR